METRSRDPMESQTYRASSDEAFDRMFERDKDDLRALGIPLETGFVDKFFEDVLVNLTLTPPPFFSRFQRLAEIVPADDTPAQAGRERYRFYRERGYELRAHNLAER